MFNHHTINLMEYQQKEKQMNNVTNIDYELLAEQRETLLNAIWEDEQSPLWGVVNLLDALIDAEDGIKVNR